MTQKFLIYYIVFINLLTFIVLSIDKWKATNRQWRISENYLLILSSIGGIFSAWFAMIIIRHKIKDTRFLLKIRAVTVVWIIGIIVFLKK